MSKWYQSPEAAQRLEDAQRLIRQREKNDRFTNDLREWFKNERELAKLRALEEEAASTQLPAQTTSDTADESATTSEEYVEEAHPTEEKEAENTDDLQETKEAASDGGNTESTTPPGETSYWAPWTYLRWW